MAEKQFIVGVGNAFLRDKTTNQIVLKAKSLLSSAIKQSVSNTEISGGVGNKLLFDWCYGKRVSIDLESASWNEEYLAISNGTSIVNAAKDFYVFDEVVVLVGGVGSVVGGTPVGDLYVQQANGSYVTITPSASSFIVSGGANTTVKVTYRINTSLNQIVIASDEYPTTYELVIKSQIVSGAGKVADIEIVIPEYKPDGAQEITFGATAASTSKMSGKAFAYEGTDGKEVYAYVNILPVTSTVSYIAIAAIPATATISSGSPTKQLSVYGIQGGIRSNVLITSAASGTTYVSGTPATATVSANGLVTKVAAGSTVITVSNQGITDTVTITSS